MSKKLDSIITGIAKKQPKIFGDIVTSASIRKVKVDSPQLSYLFGGGIPIGRMIRFRGPESSGKSIISCYCAAQLQKKLPDFLGQPDKNVVVYVDFERTFEGRFASQVGIDTDPKKFIHLLPDDVESACDTLVELIKTDEIACIILDSDAAAGSRAQMADVAGKASFGGSAKALSEFLRKINILNANYNTTMFWISQERVNMQPMSHLPSVTGGEAPKFYASVVNRVTKTDQLKDADGTIGISIRVRNYKNKTGVPFRDANMNLYYNGGFKPEEEYIDFLIAFDIVKQKGAYFYVPNEEKSLQGRVKLQDWLNNNLTAYDDMKKRVDEMLVSENKLDVNNEAIAETDLVDALGEEFIETEEPAGEIETDE